MSLGEFYHPVVRFAEDGLNLRYTLHLLALLIRTVDNISTSGAFSGLTAQEKYTLRYIFLL